MGDNSLLVFAGVAAEDAIVSVGQYPRPDQRVAAEEIRMGGGGPAATAAVAAARLGASTAVVAAVGDDEAGEKVRDRLNAEGVDVSGIQIVPGAETSRSVIVVSQDEHARAIMNLPGPQLDLEQNTESRELLQAAEWVHVDQHGFGPVRRFRTSQTSVEASRFRLSIDAGNPISGLDLRDADLYVPTMQALRERYGQHCEVEELAAAAFKEGVGRLVVTDGGNGSYAAGWDEKLVHIKAPPAEIRSTLGAGDVFHGALLAACLHAERGDLEDRLTWITQYATTVATLSCRGLDGRSCIPDHAEVLEHMADHTTSSKGTV